MFMLKKILTPFVLPPGLFIISLILAGAWFLYKKNRKAGIVNLIIACFAWLLSISPVSDVMLRGLESEFSIPENPQGDVIILLGGGINDKAPDISGSGAPADTMLSRIVTAVRLKQRLNIPIIVTGGKFAGHESSEAIIVRRFLIDLGVPANEIIIEEKSRDTIENAKFTSEICAKSGYENPILVTSAYHLKRSVMSFEKVGLEVTPFPAGFKTWPDKEYRWTAYLPGDFTKASTAIKEYLGLVFYQLVY